MGWLDDLLGLFGAGENAATPIDNSYFSDYDYDVSGGYSEPMNFGEYDFDLGSASGGGIYDPFIGEDASSLSGTLDGGGSYVNPGGIGGGIYDPFVGQDASSLSGTPDGGGSFSTPSALSRLLSGAGSVGSALASGAGKFLGGALGGANGGGLTALINQGGTDIPGGVEGVDTYSPTPLAQPAPAGLSQFQPAAVQGGTGGLEALLARLGSR